MVSVRRINPRVITQTEGDTAEGESDQAEAEDESGLQLNKRGLLSQT